MPPVGEQTAARSMIFTFDTLRLILTESVRLKAQESMSSVEDFRKAAQDFLAPEIRTLAAHIEALVKEQSALRQEVGAAESRTRAEILASESRLLAAIHNSEQLLSLKIENALLQEDRAKLQRKLDEYQKPTQ